MYRLTVKQIWIIFMLGIGVYALGLSGCLSEINFPVPENDQSGSIAIRGELIASDTPHISVLITSLSNFVNFDIPDRISGASVVLSDQENHSLEIPMQAAGRYELLIPDSAFVLQVKPGGTYQLAVGLPDGRNYLSTLETLAPVPEPTGVEQELVKKEALMEEGEIEEQEFLRLLLTTPLIKPDHSGKAYLKWTLLGTYRFREANFTTPFPPDVPSCYFYEDLNRDKVVLFNGMESRTDSLSGFLLTEEPFDYRFSGGFYLSVFQRSLSEAAYRYWENVGKAVDQSGDLFDSPPGRVSGNFQNVNDETEEVFGYFYAAQEVVLRYYIHPVLKRVKPLCPIHTRDPHFIPAPCVDCLNRPGSTREKPSFWVD